MPAPGFIASCKAPPAHSNHFEDHPLASLQPDDYNDKNEVSTGTTIMAVAFNGGVVLCADSRTSAGSYVVNRASRKISQVHDSVFVCRSGSAADTQFLTAAVRANVSQHALELGERPRVKTVAAMFRQLAYKYKDNLMAGLLVAGYDPVKGGQVYQIPLGGTMIEVPYGCGGSGSTYVFGLLDATYKPNMTEAECKAFCAKIVSHAMSRDGSSGGLIRIITVKKEGYVEEVIPGDKLPFGP